LSNTLKDEDDELESEEPCVPETEDQDNKMMEEDFDELEEEDEDDDGSYNSSAKRSFSKKFKHSTRISQEKILK
jgi:hypothetical protein